MRKLFLIATLLLLMTGSALAQTTQNTTYTVLQGDTITSIADRFNLDADAILIANNIIDPSRISVGQVLTIPTGALTVPRSHVVQPGENLIDIAIRYNTTVEALVASNDITATSVLAVGTVINLPPQGGPATFPRAYRVDIGDTLRSIGEQFGVTWQALAAYNNISNPNYVQAGIIITIPPVDYAPATGGPVVTPPPSPPVPAPTYVVQRGDTLTSVANSFNTTLEALLDANDFTLTSVLYPGDVITLPAQGGPVVQTPPPPPPPRQIINGYYTVRAGDTMFAIASEFRVNLYDLAEANGILNLNSIYSGQALYVPGY